MTNNNTSGNKRTKHKFTVERSNWLRGEGSDVSFLLRRTDRKMCCVGFFALSLGAHKKDIYGIQCLEVTLFKYDKSLTQIYDINDNEDISDKEREDKLTKEFAKIGIEISFTE